MFLCHMGVHAVDAHPCDIKTYLSNFELISAPKFWTLNKIKKHNK